jgi:hypothetical protein
MVDFWNLGFLPQISGFAANVLKQIPGMMAKLV